jgi:hypothetical protein
VSPLAPPKLRLWLGVVAGSGKCDEKQPVSMQDNFLTKSMTVRCSRVTEFSGVSYGRCLCLCVCACVCVRACACVCVVEVSVVVECEDADFDGEIEQRDTCTL